MPEYIEREVAIKEIMNDAHEQVGYSREDAADCIRYMPAADVAPVRHGHWELTGADKYGRGGIWKCTGQDGCGKFYPYKCDFCPNCGAKMNEVNE